MNNSICLSVFVAFSLGLFYGNLVEANETLGRVNHPILKFSEGLNSDKNVTEEQRQIMQLKTKEAELERTKVETLKIQINEQQQFLINSSSQISRLKEELEKFENIVIPVDWRELDRAGIEQELFKQEALTLTSTKSLQDIQQEIKKVTSERMELPQRIANLKDELEKYAAEIENKNDAGTKISTEEFAEIYKQRLQLDIDFAEKQLLGFEKRQELLKLREQKSQRKLNSDNELVQKLKEELHRRRKLEAELAIQQAEAANQQAATSIPQIRELAEELTSLAKRRTGQDGLTIKLRLAEEELQKLTEKNTQLEHYQQKLVEKVNVVGMTDVIGIFFRNVRSELPNLRQYNVENKRRRSQISSIQLEILETEEQLRVGLDNQLAKLNDTINIQSQKEEVLKTARSLLQTRRQYRESLLKDLNSYFLVMVDLDALSSQYIKKAQELTNYIDENILWIKSNRAIGRHQFKDLVGVLEWFAIVDNWLSVYRALEESFARNIIPTMLFCILLMLQVGIRTRLLRLLKKLGDDVKQSYVTSFRTTLNAFLVTVVLALLLPTVFGGLAWFLRESSLNSPFSDAVCRGFVILTGYSLFLRFMESLMFPKGLAQAHFLWVVKGVEQFRVNLHWLVPFLLCSVFLYGTTQDHPHIQAQDTLGRMVFIIILFGLALFIQRVFNPSTAWMQEYFSRNNKSWLRKFSWIWFPVSVLIPPSLAVLSAAGYHYTSLQMMLRFQSTIILLLSILLFKSLAYRLTFNLRRSLAMERIEKKVQSYEGSPDEVAIKEAEAAHQTDIPVIHLQTQRFLNGISSLLFLIGVLGIWVDVFPAFGVLNKIELWYDLQPVAQQIQSADGSSTVAMLEKSVAITLGDVFASIMVVILTTIGVNNLPGLLEITILRKLNSAPAQSYAIVTVFRYSLIVLGAVVAFSQIGIGWGKVQWLAAAFTVGLGFGLQEIFANFVAGLIILFEQPIRLGDTVTVAGTSGTVSKIRIRATTITDFNRKELIIPNKEFITGELVNWSLSDRLLRLQIPVGVAYGSNSRSVSDILYEVARRHPAVVEDPEPRIIFQNLGDSALEFDVRVFIKDLDHFPIVRSQIIHEIYETLNKEGISIPFPQRDVHLKDLPNLMEVAVKSPKS